MRWWKKGNYKGSETTEAEQNPELYSTAGSFDSELDEADNSGCVQIQILMNCDFHVEGKGNVFLQNCMWIKGANPTFHKPHLHITI